MHSFHMCAFLKGLSEDYRALRSLLKDFHALLGLYKYLVKIIMDKQVFLKIKQYICTQNGVHMKKYSSVAESSGFCDARES